MYFMDVGLEKPWLNSIKNQIYSSEFLEIRTHLFFVDLVELNQITAMMKVYCLSRSNFAKNLMQKLKDKWSSIFQYQARMYFIVQKIVDKNAGIIFGKQYRKRKNLQITLRTMLNQNMKIPTNRWDAKRYGEKCLFIRFALFLSTR